MGPVWERTRKKSRQGKSSSAIQPLKKESLIWSTPQLHVERREGEHLYVVR